MSTLVEELELAAKRSRCGAPGAGCFGCPGCAEAERLLQRAAWVRELLGRLSERDKLGIINALTGPIPTAETAPTERKEP